VSPVTRASGRARSVVRADPMRNIAGQPANSYLLTAMAQKLVRLWYDPEGDYLEVIFEQKEGYFRETAHDQVMEKVDTDGNVLGFSILRVSALRKAPLEVALS